MKVLITGAGGLIGRALGRAAVARGHEVIGVGRGPAPDGWPGHRWVVCDLAADAPVDWGRFRGAAVCHLAAETRLRDGGRDFGRDNILTAHAAAGIARRTEGRLVCMSSAAVYSGEGTRHPVTRLGVDAPTDPRTPYGRAKLEAEEAVRASGVEAVVIRLFGLLAHGGGNRAGRGSLLQAIEGAARGGAPVGLRVDEAGRHGVRDWVAMDDVCRCLLDALAAPLPAAPGVNLCTGVATDNPALVRAAERAWGRRIPVEISGPLGPENPVMVGDPAPLREWLGWAPASRVEEHWAAVASGRAEAG